jgi:hypothetical protein
MYEILVIGKVYVGHVRNFFTDVNGLLVFKSRLIKMLLQFFVRKINTPVKINVDVKRKSRLIIVEQSGKSVKYIRLKKTCLGVLK